MNILIVDDEPEILKHLVAFLERDGHETATATGGKDALELLRSEAHSFDLLITDIRMPDMNGLDLLHIIQEEDKNPILVLLMTGHLDEKKAVDESSLEFCSLMLKPFDINQLKKVISSLEKK